MHNDEKRRSSQEDAIPTIALRGKSLQSFLGSGGLFMRSL
jgi:hypothetical protein